jgi:NAD-dependent SIR2 family protein deacetylase
MSMTGNCATRIARIVDRVSTVDELADLVGAGEVMVLSGAGLSTESGIPDYRGRSGVQHRHTPMTYQTFIGDPAARRRYWARSYLGWARIASALPNAGHHAVAGLEQLGLLTGIVTQNVDGLHQLAGAADVIDLHGNLDRVICLTCRVVAPRRDLDVRLRTANPTFDLNAFETNPDGDAEVDDVALLDFQLVGCLGCGSALLKPDVVFFGENVPRPRVDAAFAVLERTRLLLVLGSSLTVMSGYRFVLKAVERGIPIAIVNQGPTRGTPHATLTVDAPLGEALTALVRQLELEPAYQAEGA